MQNKKIVLLLLIVLLCSGVNSCRSKYKQPDKQPANEQEIKPDKEALLLTNRRMLEQNIQQIKDTAKSRGWKLTETGTGAFYQRIPTAKSAPTGKIRPGDGVSLVYKLSLLDGTECYSSDVQGLKQFVVDNGEAESGLHEVLQNLYPGDSALIILPPHRAFGLTGDGNKIPPRAIVVYEIRLDSVLRHQ